MPWKLMESFAQVQVYFSQALECAPALIAKPFADILVPSKQVTSPSSYWNSRIPASMPLLIATYFTIV